MQQTYDQPKIPSINLFSKQLIFAIKLLQFAKQNISWEQIILQSILAQIIWSTRRLVKVLLGIQ